MENQRGQSIFLSVVGVATLLVAIVGATFAYFSITVEGNNTASSIQVQTALVGGVTFIDGTNIDIDEIYPGWSATKNFVVENTQAGATDTISYAIILNVTTNTITAAADGAFVYSISGTSDNSGTVVSLTNQVVPATTSTLSSSGLLNGDDTHSYTFHIAFNEMSTDQNAAQGKAFSGVLQVELASGTGKRTWDAENSTFKNYTD